MNPRAPGVEKGCKIGLGGGAEPAPGSRDPRLSELGWQVGVPEGQRALKQEPMTSKRFRFKKAPLYGAWLLEL